MTNLIIPGDNGNRDPQGPRYLTWADLESKYSQVRWAWKDWIPNGHVSMVAGPPAAGKSYLLLSLCKTMLYGGTWPDNTTYTPTVENPRIVWVETEGGEAFNIPRAKSMGIELDRIMTIREESNDGKPVCFTDAHDILAISEVAKHPDVVAVVIDSLSGGHAVNENESAVGKVVQQIATIARVTGKPLLLAHHTNKAGFDALAPTMSHVRGNGSQLQYVRTVLQLDAPDRDDPNVKRLTCTKNNLAMHPKPLGLRVTNDGPVWCEAPQTTSRTRDTSERDERVLDLVRRNVPYRDIASELGISIGTISDIVKRDRMQAGQGMSDDQEPAPS